MGAWIEIFSSCSFALFLSVAPLVGAWIEISSTDVMASGMASLPSWERGLKLLMEKVPLTVAMVAPLVGAWIEFTSPIVTYVTLAVAPLVGAWIEIGTVKLASS